MNDQEVTNMNAIVRMFRSVRGSTSPFETYYASLISRNPGGSPNAAEARRDYQAVRDSIQRVGLY